MAHQDQVNRLAQKRMILIVFLMVAAMILIIGAVLILDRSFRRDIGSVGLEILGTVLLLYFASMILTIRWTQRRGPWWLRPSPALALKRSDRKALMKAMRSGRAVTQPELAALIPLEAARARKSLWILALLSALVSLQLPMAFLTDGLPRWLTFLQLSSTLLIFGSAVFMFFFAHRARMSASATKAANPHLEIDESREGGRRVWLIAIVVGLLLLLAGGSAVAALRHWAEPTPDLLAAEDGGELVEGETRVIDSLVTPEGVTVQLVTYLTTGLGRCFSATFETSDGPSGSTGGCNSTDTHELNVSGLRNDETKVLSEGSVNVKGLGLFHATIGIAGEGVRSFRVTYSDGTSELRPVDPRFRVWFVVSTPSRDSSWEPIS